MACSPRGFWMRKSPPSASCSNWLISLTERCARSSVELPTGWAPTFAAVDLRAMSGAPAAGVDCCRLRLADARPIHTRQGREPGELPSEGAPVVGPGPHG